MFREGGRNSSVTSRKCLPSPGRSPSYPPVPQQIHKRDLPGLPAEHTWNQTPSGDPQPALHRHPPCPAATPTADRARLPGHSPAPLRPLVCFQVAEEARRPRPPTSDPPLCPRSSSAPTGHLGSGHTDHRLPLPQKAKRSQLLPWLSPCAGHVVSAQKSLPQRPRPHLLLCIPLLYSISS